jgi:hypothetical protein
LLIESRDDIDLWPKIASFYELIAIRIQHFSGEISHRHRNVDESLPWTRKNLSLLN